MALNDQQDGAALPGIPLRDILSDKVFALCVDSGMVSGHTQAMDPAPIKANASMESVVPKMPATPMDSHLKKVSEENRGTTEKHMVTLSPAHIAAPAHELKRVEKQGYEAHRCENVR